jgi:hypothetical protein
MKKIKWQYKFFGILILIILFFGVGFYLGKGGIKTAVKTEPTVKTAQKAVAPAISISTQKIKEDNFSGTMPTISGSSKLAVDARAYVVKKVAEFKKQADMDVPDMRTKFGADSPLSTYTIDIGAKEIKSTKTESIVMSIYTYTGGANGDSTYHVITTTNTGSGILSLSNIILKDQESAFTLFVQKALNDWRPEGSNAPVVFPDDVGNLKFSSFSNWSMDDQNLTIYFDKDQIGPGVLGAVAFPISLNNIKSFLDPAYTL